MAYYMVGAELYESLGDYKNACSSYNKFIDIEAESDLYVYRTKLLYLEDEHNLEKARLNEKKKREETLLIAGFIILALIIIGAFYAKSLKNARRLAEIKAHNAELESEKQRLLAENQKMEIERFKALVKSLKAESKELQNSLELNEISPQTKAVIKERLSILNKVLKTHIIQSDLNNKEVNQKIQQLIDNRKEFLDNTRITIRTINPKFVEYLNEKGLDDYEQNYLCLYILGFNGAEIEDFLKNPSHYNMSVRIREKLGIKGERGKISTYIKQLYNSLL